MVGVEFISDGGELITGERELISVNGDFGSTDGELGSANGKLMSTRDKPSSNDGDDPTSAGGEFVFDPITTIKCSRLTCALLWYTLISLSVFSFDNGCLLGWSGIGSVVFCRFVREPVEQRPTFLPLLSSLALLAVPPDVAESQFETSVVVKIPCDTSPESDALSGIIFERSGCTW